MKLQEQTFSILTIPATPPLLQHPVNSFKEIVAFARKYEILVHDLCYAELYLMAISHQLVRITGENWR